MRVPQTEDAPGEEAAPDVNVATAGEAEMDTDGDWMLDDVAKEDYGSDEDRCREYLRALQVVLGKGRVIACQALTHRKELHLV